MTPVLYISVELTSIHFLPSVFWYQIWFTSFCASYMEFTDGDFFPELFDVCLARTKGWERGEEGTGQAAEESVNWRRASLSLFCNTTLPYFWWFLRGRLFFWVLTNTISDNKNWLPGTACTLSSCINGTKFAKWKTYMFIIVIEQQCVLSICLIKKIPVYPYMKEAYQ